MAGVVCIDFTLPRAGLGEKLAPGEIPAGPEVLGPREAMFRVSS